MFLRFDQVDLIVEAKRFDYPAQRADQWAKEWVAYQFTEGGVGPSTAVLFAVGGLGSEPEATVEQLRSQANACLGEYQGGLPAIAVAAASWRSLAQAVGRRKEAGDHEVNPFLLQDILEVFDYFRIRWRKPQYLSELPQWASRYATRDQSTDTVREWASLAARSCSAGWLDRVAAYRPIASSSIKILMRLQHAP